MATTRTGSHSMRRTEWLVRGLLAAVLAYGVVAVWDYNREVWPIFSWNLFTKVPAAHSGDYDIRIVDGQGLRVRTPAYFEDARTETDQSREIQAYQTLQNWGRAHRNHDVAGETAVRKRFEALYLGGLSHVRYEFVQRIWDIRTRLECPHCFTAIRVLATYSKN